MHIFGTVNGAKIFFVAQLAPPGVSNKDV